MRSLKQVNFMSIQPTEGGNDNRAKVKNDGSDISPNTFVAVQPLNSGPKGCGKGSQLWVKKRKWWHFQNMSAVPPATGIRRGERHVCFMPEADSCIATKKLVLFDHLVGAEEKRLRNVEAQRLCRLQIDEQLKPCRLLHRKITGIGAFEYHVEVARRLADHLRDIRSIGDQAACLDPCTPSSHQRQALPIGKLYDALRIGHRVPRRHDVEAVDAGLLRRFKRSVEFSRIVYSDRQQLELQGFCCALGDRWDRERAQPVRCGEPPP